MRRPATLLVWAVALGSPVAAWLKNPFLKSVAGTSRKPPAETGITAVEQDQLALGWSPRPTEAPELYGRMALAGHMEGYTLGTETCGYKCIDYDASAAGDCDLPSDFHTLCCATSLYGACFTWVISNTGSGSELDSTYTLLDCSAASGTSTLFDYDPAWAATHSFSSTVSSVTTDTPGTNSDSDSSSDTTGSGSTASQTTETSAATSDSASDDDGGHSTPVGAIAGRVVSGVALIALMGLIIFFLRRKKNKNQ
ncbi:hypothetical protein EDB81DRAFT_876819 [Dactylonectria macrodidyma]|uniref:Uncharacterized protein n=1 Tax=Dactylonectria macrodidyma TaxID=307937 RepID=A0A9P9FR35_9HYPO|nr:hypothetical protein EDB81DRAFT_876819 [Dactylonectria macrodidyma]